MINFIVHTLISIVGFLVIPETIRAGDFSNSKITLDVHIDDTGQFNKRDDGQIETSPVRTGERVSFEIFIGKGSGKNTIGYSIVFDDKDNIFTKNFKIEKMEGILPQLGNAKDNIVSAGTLSAVTIPPNNYLATITLTAKRDIEHGLIISLLGGKEGTGIAGSQTFENETLDVSGAFIIFQADFVEAIPGDIDRDGDVDFSDFTVFASNFGKTGQKPTERIKVITQTVTLYDTILIESVVRDTVFQTIDNVVRDTVFQTSLLRDTVYVDNPATKIDTIFITNTDPEVRPPLKASWTEVVNEIEKSVYWLGYTAKGNFEVKFVGTGFCVGPWFIATNAHVAIALWTGVNTVRETQKLDGYAVAIKAGTTFHASTTIELDNDAETPLRLFRHPEYDINNINSPDVALIWILNSQQIPKDYLRLAPDSALWDLDVGAEIGTLGFPGAVQTIPTFKVGTISALRPYEDRIPKTDLSTKMVQHDFDTTPGTSGSPIFNKRSEVIALNFAGFETGSLGFGIRADELREIIKFLGHVNEGNIPNTKPAISILKNPRIQPVDPPPPE